MSRLPESSTSTLQAKAAHPLADLAAFAGTGAPFGDGSVEAQRFTFTCFGTRCAARIEHGADTSRLVVEADLGPMPYSIDGRPRRRMTRAVVRASRALRHSRWLIGSTQRIRMEIVARLTRPVTPAALLYEPLRALIEARPYIEILKDVASAPARRGD